MRDPKKKLTPTLEWVLRLAARPQGWRTSYAHNTTRYDQMTYHPDSNPEPYPIMPGRSIFWWGRKERWIVVRYLNNRRTFVLSDYGKAFWEEYQKHHEILPCK